MGKIGTASTACGLWLGAAAAGLAFAAAGAAVAQPYSPAYPPAYPPADARAYPAPGPDDEDGPPPPPRYAQPHYADPRPADPRYADPRYADGRDSDPRYDPRYDDPRYQRRYARSNSYAPRYDDPRLADAPPPAAAAARQGGDPYADPAYLAWRQRYFGQRADTAPPPPLQPTMAPVAPPPPPAAPDAPPQAAAPVAPGGQATFAPHLPHRLTEAADAYAAYIKQACAINAAFKSGASVADAVKTGAGYESHQFEEGAIAYAALTALKEPAFVDGVRRLLAEGDRGSDFADHLAAEPDAVLNIASADVAAARAASALRRHGEHLAGVGAQVKQAAYDVQHSAWSKAQVTDPDGRLALAKTRSNTRATLTGEDAPELLKAVQAEVGDTGQVQASPVVVRALAIAALAALGQLRDGDDPRLAALLSEPRSADCLKMAKLNLFQCLSVARPHYEDIFCLGQHAMMDTGQCVVKAAGFTPVPVTMARADGSQPAR